MIKGDTRVVGIIGDPVEHSLSPIMHNSAFRHLNMNYVYVAFKVRKEALREAIEGVRALDMRGVNVTIPHKISVLSFLDWLDENAEKIGAVNTIVVDEGVLRGYNTDGVGGLKALVEEGVNVEGMKVVLLGAGGAARALAYTFAPLASEIVILNRTVRKALSLASELEREGWNARGGGLSESVLGRELRDADLLVNATSVGMHPNVEESPVPSNLLRSDMAVFDIVYNPVETRLLRDARRVGAKTVDGVGMLVNQGAIAFKLWTGVEPPRDVMREPVVKALHGGRSK